MSISPEEVVDRLKKHPRLIVAEDVELVVEYRRTHVDQFECGKKTLEKSNDDWWLSLRLLHVKNSGCAVVHGVSNAHLELLVDQALSACRLSSGDPWFRFPIWSDIKHSSQLEGPTNIQSVYPLLSKPPRYLKEECGREDTATHIWRRSEKYQRQQARSRFSIKTTCVDALSGGLYWREQSRGSSQVPQSPRQWAESLLLEDGQGLASTNDCENLALTSSASSTLLQFLAPHFYAGSDESLRPRFNAVINISDDGNLLGSYNARAFDMEGLASCQTSVIQKGVLKSLLHDSYSATRENRRSTANFSRVGEEPWPRIAPTCLYIHPSFEFDEQRVSQGRWVWLHEITKLANLPTTGAVRVTGLAQVKDDGAWLGPPFQVVWDVSLDTLYGNVVSVGNDLDFFQETGSPSIFIEKMPLHS